MPFPWLAFGIMLLLSIGLSAIQYLLRPKPQKGDVFDSKTYHLDGMSNSIEIGVPINVPYGVHKIAPQIRNYYINSKGDDTEIEALLSCGEGVINGIRDLRMNDQSFFSLVSYEREENGRLLNGFWLTFGEKIQKVYRSANVQEYDLANTISPGFNVTITIKLDYVAFQELYQNASASEPGYVIVYNWKGATKKSGENIDNTETVQYTGKAQEAGTGYLQLTGCRVTKSHTGGLASVRQEYKIAKNNSGTVHESIPGFTKTVINHQEVDTNVNFDSPVTITTVNQVEAFAVVLGFKEGLYNFDDEKGYQKAKVKIGIKWWKNGTSWSGSTTAVTTTRTETATKNHYIKLEKKKNYGYLVDANGAYIEGTEAELDQLTDWDIIMPDDVLEFTLGSTTYKCTVTKNYLKEPIGETTYESEYIPVETIYRLKVRFKPLEPEPTILYQGPSASKASYKFTYQKIEYNNYYETEISPTKGKLADYRLTFLLPEMEKFGKLDDAKYKIQVEKLTKDRTNSQSGINTMTLIEVQEITIDNLCYPHEAMLGIRFTSNEKISGSINNITCIVEGRVLKDVQNTGNPDRLSSNFYDIFADVITNKRYGRGKELNLSSSELTDFYAKLAPEAAFCDHSITENNKARKRLETHVNIDFKKPTVDVIQALSITARSNIYWDGAKPLAYVDRTAAPAAMFGAANIIPGSYRVQSMDLTDNVNRIYPQYLDKDKNYTHGNVARDLRDEGFTINKLRPKSIAIYGITDRWRAIKITNYLLRFAKFVQRGRQFDVGGDAITIDIGKSFYYINSKGNCGRVLTVNVNNITLDKAFTLESGKTYKALIRKDDGTPHAELTVDVNATGLGSKTIIYFTQIISGVTLATNPIYGIGVAGEYYDAYRCVTKNSKGSSYEIVGALYNVETYRLYQGDPSDPSTTINIEEITSLHPKTYNPHMAPPNITSLKAVEDKTTMGAATVHIQRPISTLWSHAEIYISDENGDDIEQSVGRTRGEPLRITGLLPDIEYTIRAISYSAGNISNPTPFLASITLAGTEPPRVGGLSIINNRGNKTEMFGRDFKVRCHDMSGFKSDDLVRKTYENEGIRYLWEVYYSGLPDTVKLGTVKANSKIAYSEITRLNEFDFSLEENIEATKQFWKSYDTFAAAQYSTYYSNPQREITVLCWLINAWGKMSPAPAAIKLINPAPDMKDAAGVVITPTLRKIKGGLRIEFTHPDKEYDIIDFIVRVAKDAAFTTGLKRIKVTSTINVDSSDDDVALAKYKTEIDGLDVKQTYYVEVIPRDPFGKGTASNIASSKPGITNDDDELDLARPTRYDHTKITVTPDIEINDDGKTVVNLMVKGEKASETDVDGYILEVRMVNDTAAVTPPTGAEIDAGITAGGKKCEGNTYQIAIDGEAGTGTTDTNYFKKKIPDVKNNWTGFFRIRKQNTSGQVGPWSSDTPGQWVSFVTTKANNAADTTAPAAPTVAIIQEGQTIGITASIASPPADLQGFQFAVKSTAFTSDADRLNNKHADIDASAGKAKDTYYGVAGSSYYISSRSYDFSKNYSAWVDYASNPVELAGLTLDSLSEPISMAIYTGSFTATAANVVIWGNGSKVKIKRTGAATKEYTITNGTTGALAGTRYIVFNKATSTTDFSVVATPGDNDIVIAKVEPVTSGKANIVRFVGEKEGEYSIGRYSGSFNQLSAMIAYLGKVIIQNGDEGSLNLLDAVGKTAIKLKVNSGADPDLVIMKSGQDAEGNSGADAVDPSKVAFSTKLIVNAVTSRASYKKIVDEFTYIIPDNANWQNKSIAAETTEYAGTVHISGGNFPSGYGIALPREVAGLLFVGTASATDCREPAWGSTVDGTDSCYQYVQINFRNYLGEGLVRLDRVCINPTGGSLTLPSMVGTAIKITVYADLVG